MLDLSQPGLLGLGNINIKLQTPEVEDSRYASAIELMKRKSLKEDTGKKYLSIRSMRPP